MKTSECGPIVHWFECECGYRWEGMTQSAKTLAHRLHRKKCNTASLSNTALRSINVHKEGKTAAIDACVRDLKDGVVPYAADR